jgi:hypothetical protein
MKTARLEAFSDGVLAIAVALLIPFYWLPPLRRLESR